MSRLKPPCFPYVTVDRIHESTPHTGSKTLIRVNTDDGPTLWEPFNYEHAGRYSVSRHLYKNVLGNKLCFEENNHDLQLSFRYTWAFSEAYGIVRQAELRNLSASNIDAEVLDGLQNLLPAGTPRFTQTNSSNLVDAYKWTELDDGSGVAMYTLYSGITDRAEPCESLRANTVFSLGLENPLILLSSQQVDVFRQHAELSPEMTTRGIRGAYFVHQTLSLSAKSSHNWHLVAGLEQSQTDVTRLIEELANPIQVTEHLNHSIEAGSDALNRIMAAADGLQTTAEENVAVHHYANVLFNVLRGGIFNDQYKIDRADFSKTLSQFNQSVSARHQGFLGSLETTCELGEFLTAIEAQGNLQLTRLALEYLSVTFGRRHGDPSRPWNQFAIELKDEHGDPLLSYQGNWRDIFQNWEALLMSYPEFTESVIAKFVNASTMDGYNPYRITKQGIDWEVEEPDDPWSYIGYWGDHQIIYLQKLLEVSVQFHPGKLAGLLNKDIFCYANVPYRLKPYADMLINAKDHCGLRRRCRRSD